MEMTLALEIEMALAMSLRGRLEWSGSVKVTAQNGEAWEAQLRRAVEEIEKHARSDP